MTSPHIDTVEMQLVPDAGPRDFDQFRRIVVSPTVNPPEPFEGYAGYCGWPSVCRLHNGDLFVAFSQGYWHASWPTPLDAPSATLDRWKSVSDAKHAWILDWHAPQGGRIMWTRSRDRGLNWTAPRPFPQVHGAYYVACITQLEDGTMLAGARVSPAFGYWSEMPATPVEFARAAAHHLPERIVIFRSDDNGETWCEFSWFCGPFYMVDAPYSITEAPDGAILALVSGSPIPAGPGWPNDEERWVHALMRSIDQGRTWSAYSIIGSNEFDTTEGSAAFLPDGSLGFATRPTSAWFQSYDGGKTWTLPRRLHEGDISAGEYGKKLFKKGCIIVTPDHVVAQIYCGGFDGNKVCSVVYSRDSGRSWFKPKRDRGFIVDPIAYYPSACLLDDGSILVIGDHQGWPSEYGPWSAEVTAIRFHIKSPEEGEGIELLPLEEGNGD